jgi:hypothetical protein
MILFLNVPSKFLHVLQKIKRDTGESVADQIRKAIEVHVAVLEIDREVEKKKTEDAEWERIVQNLI